MALELGEVRDGAIEVLDQAAGHRFTFKLATGRGGAQVLDAMRPAWSGGQEPSDAHGLSIEARQIAEREARDRGWTTVGEPDVG